MSKIQNIFHNDFYNEPVMPNWSWEISIISNPIEGWTEEQMSIFSKAVTKVNIPDLEMLTTASQFRGLTFDVPTRLENNGEITLTFNEDSDMTLYKDLRNKLYYTSYNDGYIIDEWSKLDEKTSKPIDTYMLYYAPFDIHVKLMNPESPTEIAYIFIFHNCFITSISDVEFKYNSEEVAVYDVKIHYNFRLEGTDAEEYYIHIHGGLNEADNEKAEAIPDIGDEDTTDDEAQELPESPKTEGIDPTTPTESTPTEAPKEKTDGVETKPAETKPEEQAPKPEKTDGVESKPAETKPEEPAPKAEKTGGVEGPAPAASTQKMLDDDDEAERSKTKGVESQQQEETPQERMRREAQEKMSGYKPAPTAGVEKSSTESNGANRSYSPGHDAPADNFENKPAEHSKDADVVKKSPVTNMENGTAKPKKEEVPNEKAKADDISNKPATNKSAGQKTKKKEEENTPTITQKQQTEKQKTPSVEESTVKSSKDKTDKWKTDINNEDFDSFGNIPMEEPPSNSEVVTDSWKNDVNNEDLAELRNTPVISPENQAALDELESMNLDDEYAPAERTYKDKKANDFTADDWSNYENNVKYYGQEMKKQAEKDEKDKVVRFSKSMGASKADRDAIEADYKSRGYTVIWY